METYLYLVLFPESLVVSMLGPSEFGAYLATGTKKRAREQAMYFHLDEEFVSNYFDLAKARKACIPHEAGRPKHSVYISTYRVLERIPLKVIKDLWLITRDGRGLKLHSTDAPEGYEGSYHLYQELCPVHPLIASSLNAQDFSRFITDPEVSVSVPRICFVEMDLADMANDPSDGDAGNLPYNNIMHLRDCLVELVTKGKMTQTINRVQHEHIPHRCVKNGFFVGDRDALLYYPFPSPGDMEKNHHYWLRSAGLT